VTARRRASDAGSALRRGFAQVPPARVAVDDEQVSAAPVVPSVPDIAASVSATLQPKKGSKYTAMLDGETAEAFDELALKARKLLGRRVEKSELIRVMIMLVADDASLREQVIAEVEARRGAGKQEAGQ
jgi:hypothetical protein